MEVSFSNTNPAGSAPAPQVPEVKTPEPAASVPVVQSSSGSQIPATRKFLLGDRLPNFSQVILPRLNIVQGIGNLKDTFAPGEIVFNQATVLFTPPQIDAKTGNAIRKGTPPITAYVVGIISDRFSEVVVGGFGGLIVDTEADVRNNGGTLDYKEWELKSKDGMKRFQPITDLLMLVERPEVVKDDDIVFNFTIEGRKYALGAWALKGSAYTAVMKRVFNYHRLAGILKDGYPTYGFAVSTHLEKFKNGNSAWVPNAIPIGKTSSAVLAFIHEVAGTPV
jgi:hypothetical protein